MLVSVLAPAPVTNCKRRGARRAQPPEMPQPAAHWAGGEMQPGARCGDQGCTHPRFPPGASRQQHPPPTAPAPQSPSTPHLVAGAGTGTDSPYPTPPALSVPPAPGRSLPSPPNSPCRNKHPVGRKIAWRRRLGGAPGEQEGILFADGQVFFPQLSPQTHLSAYRSLKQIHFCPI